MKENYKSAYIYLKENYYKKPKHLFNFIFNIIKSRKKIKNSLSLLDVGCARGEFLYHAQHQKIFSRLSGVDYSQTLIKHAKSFKGLQNVAFYCAPAEKFHFKEKFDVITLSGLLAFFDDVNPLLRNLKRHLKRDGFILITGFFNPLKVDAIVRYRNKEKEGKWEKGWNHISIDTVQECLDKIGMKVKAVHKFHLPMEIAPQKDPMRGWTVRLDGKKKFMIGLGFVYDVLTLEVDFKKG